MAKYKRGYVTGVFDLFHIGHLNLIRRAKEMCDYLIVGVVKDELPEKYKGKRPVIPLSERLAIVEAIRYVDEAFAVDWDTWDKVDAWRQHPYDCCFCGDDYAGRPEWDKVREDLRAVGADLHFFPYTKERTSTMIREATGRGGEPK